MFDEGQYYHSRKIVGEGDIDDPETNFYFDNANIGMVNATFLPLIMHSNDNAPSRLVGLALLPSGKTKDEYVRIGRAGIDMVDMYMLKDSNLVPREITIV